MSLSAAEKLEVIRLVEGSELPVRRTLTELGVSRSIFYAGIGNTWMLDQRAWSQPVGYRVGSGTSYLKR